MDLAERLKSQRTVPNMLTSFRILTVPFIATSMYFESWGIAATLYAMAALSDFLDGFLARRANAATDFGQIFDPIADKILTNSMIVAFAMVIESPLFWILFGINISYDINNTWRRRDDITNVLREVPIGDTEVPVTVVSKLKTAFLFITIWFLFLSFLLPWRASIYVSFLGDILAMISMLLILWAGATNRSSR